MKNKGGAGKHHDYGKRNTGCICGLLFPADFNIRDIRYQTAADKNLTEQQLHKGYQYTKKMRSKLGSSGDVKVKITELDAPRVYAAEFTCATGKNMISYVIESLEKEKITVTYTEDFSGKSASHNLNYKVVGALYKRRAKKKMARMLHNMESYIRQGSPAQSMLADKEE